MDKKRHLKIAKLLGKSIAAMRSRSGMTQEEVAERLGLGFEAVSRMERGIVEPTVPRLVELAEIFGCPFQDLILPASDRLLDQAHSLSRIVSNLGTQDREFFFHLASELAAYIGKGSDKRGKR